MQMLTPLVCTEASTKEDFELRTTKDIADVLQTPEAMLLTTALDRAKLYEQCRLLSANWGGTSAKTFLMTGPAATH